MRGLTRHASVPQREPHHPTPPAPENPGTRVPGTGREASIRAPRDIRRISIGSTGGGWRVHAKALATTINHVEPTDTIDIAGDFSGRIELSGNAEAPIIIRGNMTAGAVIKIG